MSIIDFFKGRWSLEPLERPWAPLPSIYDHLRDHIDEVTGKLTDPGADLPDEEVVFPEGGLRWVAGAMDGVMGHHIGDSDERLRAKQAAKAIADLLETASDPKLAHLYQLATRESMLSIVDEVLESLVGSVDAELAGRCFVLGMFLARHGGHREIVKLGISLLGIVEQGDEDLDVVRTLGLHEEFTLFAAVALSNRSGDPERELWRLAQKVDGWGRIHLVERISETEDPEIRDWLIREGFRNSIMYEYLACICARSGGLADALDRRAPDPELMAATAEILDALISGGPAEDIRDYEDAARVSVRFARVVADGRLLEAGHFVAIRELSRFLADADEAAHLEDKWGPRAAICRELCDEIVVWPEWEGVARAAQNDEDPAVSYQGDRMAQLLGLDSWQLHFDRIKLDPIGSNSWFRLMQETNPERIDAVVDFAARALPLDEIASGPSDEMGFGPEFEPHRTLDWVVQDLGKFPTKGWSLLAAALESPVVRGRNMALRALAAWGRASWPEDAEQALTLALEREPEEEIKETIRKVLEGTPLD